MQMTPSFWSYYPNDDQATSMTACRCHQSVCHHQSVCQALSLNRAQLAPSFNRALSLVGSLPPQSSNSKASLCRDAFDVVGSQPQQSSLGSQPQQYCLAVVRTMGRIDDDGATCCTLNHVKKVILGINDEIVPVIHLWLVPLTHWAIRMCTVKQNNGSQPKPPSMKLSGGVQALPWEPLFLKTKA